MARDDLSTVSSCEESEADGLVGRIISGRTILRHKQRTLAEFAMLSFSRRQAPRLREMTNIVVSLDEFDLPE